MRKFFNFRELCEFQEFMESCPGKYIDVLKFFFEKKEKRNKMDILSVIADDLVDLNVIQLIDLSQKLLNMATAKLEVIDEDEEFEEELNDGE